MNCTLPLLPKSLGLSSRDANPTPGPPSMPNSDAESLAALVATCHERQ